MYRRVINSKLIEVLLYTPKPSEFYIYIAKKSRKQELSHGVERG